LSKALKILTSEPVRSMRHPPSGASATLDTLRAKRYFDPKALSGYPSTR
jgi:hypothetical protein